MKKYIALAALFAAGSAFANADVTTVATMEQLIAVSTNNGVTVSSDWTYEGGNVYDFTAGNAYFSNGDASLLTTTTGYLTIGAWVYIEELGVKDPAPATDQEKFLDTVFGWGENGKGFKFNVKNGGNEGNSLDLGELGFVTKWNSQKLSSRFNTANFNAGWHHVAVSLNMNGGTDGAFFLDGAALGTFSGATAWNVPTNNTFAIGSQNSDAYSEGFQGLMAGLTLYASEAVLDASTVSGLMGGAPIPEPSVFGLLAGLGALALVGTRRRRR